MSTVGVRDFLGLQPTDDPSRWRMPVRPRLLTHAGAIQGGAAFAGAVEAMQLVVGRPLVWASAQFVRHAGPSVTLDVDVSVELSGRQTTQARASMRLGDAEVLAAWGALGARPFGASGVWPEQPSVPRPDDAAPFELPTNGAGGISDHLDVRLAATPGPGRWAAWCRRRDDDGSIAAGDLAMFGDLSMLAFSSALGRRCTGNSLDNSLRVVSGAAAGWVLLDVYVDAVHDGFGHVRSHLWGEDGALLAIAGQTLVLRDADGHGRSVRPSRQIVGD